MECHIEHEGDLTRMTHPSTPRTAPLTRLAARPGSSSRSASFGTVETTAQAGGHPGSHSRPSRTSLWLIGVALGGLSVACGTGQIGGEVNTGEGGPALGRLCEVEEIVPLDEEDASLGFSASELMVQLEGVHEASLAWAEPNLVGDVSVTPSSGTSQISFTISPDPDTVRRFDIEPASSGMEGGETLGLGGDAGACEDQLAFDAAVEVVSANGALNEVFTVTFYATSGLVAQGRVALDLAALEGNFQATLPEGRDNAKLKNVQLNITFAAGSPSGSITGGVEETQGEATSYLGVTFGSFPAEEAETCALGGYPIDPEGELALAAKSALSSLTEFSLTWSGMDPTPLTLSHEFAAPCLVDPALEAEPSVIWTVTTHASTEDDTVDGTWALEGRVTLDPSGDSTSATLLRQAYLADSYQPGSFAESSGISAFAVDPTKAGTFSFSVSDDFTDQHPAAGELTVIELTPADCSEQEPIETEQGGAAPGCAGNTAEEIGGATISGQ